MAPIILNRQLRNIGTIIKDTKASWDNDTHSLLQLMPGRVFFGIGRPVLGQMRAANRHHLGLH